jgi:predicted secreted protein
MSDIGVPINQAKSVIASKPAVEYLKVTTLNTENVSALSWRMLISNNSFMGRINTVYTLLDRGYIGGGGLVNWLQDVTCQAIGKGNINFTLFCVLTKF